jgi:DNA-binding NarL/FixJ family response regulator
MIRILLVDDHKIFTEGIKALLTYEAGYDVIGECQNALQVKEILQSKIIDVVLLDINLGKDSGLDLCKYISDNYPKVRILCVSMYNEESFITKMLKNGALGYLLKNTGADELLKAIKTVNEGKTYQSTEVLEIIMKGMSKQKNYEKNLYQIRFTRREKEIMDLIAQGKTTKDMSKDLFISEKTVETHRSNLLSKFGVKNVTGFLKLAIEYGYIK